MPRRQRISESWILYPNNPISSPTQQFGRGLVLWLRLVFWGSYHFVSCCAIRKQASSGCLGDHWYKRGKDKVPRHSPVEHWTRHWRSLNEHHLQTLTVFCPSESHQWSTYWFLLICRSGWAYGRCRRLWFTILKAFAKSMIRISVCCPCAMFPMSFSLSTNWRSCLAGSLLPEAMLLVAEYIHCDVPDVPCFCWSGCAPTLCSIHWWGTVVSRVIYTWIDFIWARCFARAEVVEQFLHSLAVC